MSVCQKPINVKSLMTRATGASAPMGRDLLQEERDDVPASEFEAPEVDTLHLAVQAPLSFGNRGEPSWSPTPAVEDVRATDSTPSTS